MARPHAILVSGPNGAGKSTAALALVRDLLGVTEYINADLIAQGLSAFDSESVARQAGRVMRTRLRQLAGQGRDLAFETTLATRRYAPWRTELRASGYEIDIVFLWLSGAELAIARVEERVRAGGHDIAPEVVRRRFTRGLQNVFRLYQPLADRWWFLDNAGVDGPRLLASGGRAHATEMLSSSTWRSLVERYG